MTLNSQQLDCSDIGADQPHGVDGRTDLKACIGCQTGCANRKPQIVGPYHGRGVWVSV
jgi:hypothetical protein